MENSFKIKGSKDAFILCSIFSCSVQEVLQYYVNHVSIDKFLEETGNKKFITATTFFLKYGVQESD
jgi:hypothetical protein